MVIAAAGTGRKEFYERTIRKELEKALQMRECITAGKGSADYIAIVDGTDKYGEEIICPIICEGDVIGSVIFLKKEDKKKFGEAEQKVAQSAAVFLGKQMEQ